MTRWKMPLHRKRGRMLVLMFSVLGMVIGSISPAFAMYGGSNAPSYSFMASIQSADHAQYCGGVLVDSQAVLTAWHCVERLTDRALATLSVRIGSNDRTRGGIVAGFVGSPVHVGDDTALLWLNRTVPQKPIKIIARKPTTGTATVTLGWGAQCSAKATASQCQRTPMPKRLQQLSGKIVQCKGVVDHPLCVRYKTGKRTEGGDSGGPAIVRVKGAWMLAGTLSGAPGSAIGKAPPPANQTWFTDVAHWRSVVIGITHHPSGA